MKFIVILLLTSTLVGCAEFNSCPRSRYRPGDPCIIQGEKFQQLPNWEYEAIVRKNRGEDW